MLSETDLKFVTQSLYADIPPRVLHKMISFNFQVSELHFVCDLYVLKITSVQTYITGRGADQT